MIKSLIALAVLTMAGTAANACNIVRGNANLAPNQNGTHTLTCTGQEECANLSCDGKTITIYINGGTVRGTIVALIVDEEHADETISIEEAVVQIDQQD